MTNSRDDAESLLPLPLATFHILLALADEERHGVAKGHERDGDGGAHEDHDGHEGEPRRRQVPREDDEDRAAREVAATNTIGPALAAR